MIKYIPASSHLIEPFCGDGDLLSLLPLGNWECYDIEPHSNSIQRDTLLNPPEYKNKWVITNPPYLAQNKAKDKTIYSLYNVDDLYKASMVSMLDVEGGILIIPTNFFTDERTGAVRKQFLNKFSILELNIFTQPIFETTTYSIWSFAFQKKEEDIEQRFAVNIYPENKRIEVKLAEEYDYRIAGEFYVEITKTPNIFGRVIAGARIADYIIPIKLYALDTRTTHIHLEYNEDIYYGKMTDRIYATLTCKYQLTSEQCKKLIEEFNKRVETFRQEYCDIAFTNYRDYNRKRIGFDFAYCLLSTIYNELYTS